MTGRSPTLSRARGRASASSIPDWTDLSVHDPGMVLVEAFAHLTDLLIYRLNRVPDKLYAVYLNLLGTVCIPAVGCARCTLRFSRVAPDGPEVRIPRGTTVSPPPGVPGEPQPVFSTLADAVLAAGATHVDVDAADVTLEDAVLLGVGTGSDPARVSCFPSPPQSSGNRAGHRHRGRGRIRSRERGGDPRRRTRLPALPRGGGVRGCDPGRACGAGRPLRRGGAVRLVERRRGAAGTAPAAQPAAKSARRLRELRPLLRWCPHWCPPRGRRCAPGTAPVAVPEAMSPPERSQFCEVRSPGVRVTNPEPANGGRDGERLEDALRRAPQDFQARDRAVTARDYEVLAARHGGVGRARALTRSDVWSFARPGEVEVVLVPSVPEDAAGSAVGLDQLAEQATEGVRTEVEAYLGDRATIGATPVVRWALYKQVIVDARVVVRPEEDPDAVRERIIRRLADTITPLPRGGGAGGTGFGRPLRVSNLYRAMEESEPGVQYVDRVRIEVDKVPDTDATGLVRASGQAGTWFVSQDEVLFRTTNYGDGWEAVAAFAGEKVRAIVPFHSGGMGGDRAPSKPGMVAVATESGSGSRVYVSDNLGESWRRAAELGFVLADMAWVDRDGSPVLLLAGEKGLYELADAEGAVPVQNLVDKAQPDRGFYAIDAFVDVRGQTGVLLAAEAAAGVWLSASAGAPESFGRIRGAGEDIRCLSVQYDGPTTYLWIGRAVPEGAGTGCARLRIDDLARMRFDESLLTSWEELGAGWGGGSCWGVEVVGDSAYAATQSGGVLRLPLQAGNGARWDSRDVNCGLPLRDRARFEPVRGVSGDVRDGEPLVLAAGPKGIHRSTDHAATWATCTPRSVTTAITLPPTWLFCSGDHRIEVVRSRD